MIIYIKAAKQVKLLPSNINLCIDEVGFHVNTKDQKETILWKDVNGILNRPGMVVILSSFQHGFILNNQVLNYRKTYFLLAISNKIKCYS